MNFISRNDEITCSISQVHIFNVEWKFAFMEENKDIYPRSSKKEPNDNKSPNENIHSLTTTINSLSAELDEVRKSLQKRKSENTTLKILFYTGLFVLLVGFLYSNSVLQRAHIKSLEKNIISLEQRLSHDISQVVMNLELAIQKEKKGLKLIDDTDIFTVLDRMDYAISQLHLKKEQTVMLVNQVRLNADEFSRLLKKQTKNPKTTIKHSKNGR